MVLLTVLLLTACSSVSETNVATGANSESANTASIGATNSATAAAPEPQQNVFSQGSLFQQTYHGNWLQSRKPRRTGDIITVVLVENINAKKSSSVSYDKSQGLALADIKAGTTNIIGIDVDSKNKFVGKGNSSKSNALNGNIAVRITQVLDNNLFKIKGERHLQVNEGGEAVIIEGVVRAKDIQSNNTILSTNIADAHISYVSQGMMDAVSQPGWLMEFIYRYFPI